MYVMYFLEDATVSSTRPHDKPVALRVAASGTFVIDCNHALATVVEAHERSRRARRMMR
jgi:hypothetical protein